MCGIAGIIHRDGREASPVSIARMTDVIKHRGPDFQDSFCYQNMAFGHVRLSILDLSSMGHQPMHSDDHRHTIIYNGEVYNFQDIREDLISKGHNFRSSSDTEVILNAYLEWGEDCVSRFNGMFAFAILNRDENQIFFARDRFGIKPLYYGEFNNTFLFGSEIKAIEEHEDYRFEVNKEGLKEYFSFQNFLSSQTLNAGVSMFPAGHTGVLNLEDSRNKSLILKCYWDYNFQEPENSISEKECEEELERLFQTAVERQLVSDVELGSYLSGGMDSGSITAVSASKIDRMHTFTCGFDMSSASDHEQSFDERQKARDFSNYFGTQHHEVMVKHSDMEDAIPKIAWHLEEPRVGQSYPNLYAAELARSKVKVVLSGAGGDELFAGYPWRYYRAVHNKNSKEYLDKYFAYWQRLVPEGQQSEFFAPIWSDIKDFSIRDTFESVYTDSLNTAKTPEDYVNESLYFEAKTFMHGLLVLEDKLSMAHSLESRVPILDNDLVDFAMKIPARYKLSSLDKIVDLAKNNRNKDIETYFHRSKDGKMIFRNAMQNLLPKETSKREKQGFSGPDASWFLNESAGYIKTRLLDKDSGIYDYLNYDAVSNELGAHFNGAKNSRLLIWSLLSAQSWFDQRP